MPRVARARSESGFYHVVAKGNGGQNLFEDASDYRAFLELVAATAEKCGVFVHAYCLMSNHVHLLLEDQGGRLSEFMKSLSATGYATRFNAKASHIGHVFQQRFKSQPVEDEAHLLQAVRYIHNNPAKAGMLPGRRVPVEQLPRVCVGRPGNRDRRAGARHVRRQGGVPRVPSRRRGRLSLWPALERSAARRSARGRAAYPWRYRPRRHQSDGATAPQCVTL